MEFACDSGLAAVACNLSNLISFCILLAVANISISAPQAMVPAMLGTSGVLLAGPLSLAPYTLSSAGHFLPVVVLFARTCQLRAAPLAKKALNLQFMFLGFRAGLLVSRKLQPAKTRAADIPTASANPPAPQTTRRVRHFKAIPTWRPRHAGAAWGSGLAAPTESS